MEQSEILSLLNSRHDACFDKTEFVRDSGSVAYAVYAGKDRYFLRITKPAFHDTVVQSLDIHVFLQKRGFPVPPVILPGTDCHVYM